MSTAPKQTRSRRAAPAKTVPPAGPPAVQPIGLAVSSGAKVLGRAFERAMAEAGGSQPTWLILLSLKQQRWRTQQELARAVGIEGPTLTHHLDGLEKAGLIERSRDPEDRRAVRVEMTDAGDKLFHRMREAAVGFDQRLRSGLSERELDQFRRVLARLRENVAND